MSETNDRDEDSVDSESWSSRWLNGLSPAAVEVLGFVLTMLEAYRLTHGTISGHGPGEALVLALCILYFAMTGLKLLKMAWYRLIAAKNTRGTVVPRAN